MSLNKTNIDWINPKDEWKLDYTWNPIIGCNNSCYYCYARKLHNKRHEAYKEGKKMPIQYAKPYEEIQFIELRLDVFAKNIKPSTIFVGSMCDMFNYCVPEEWITKVLRICNLNTQHRFMFLTKTPERYNDFNFGENCWLGTTAINGSDPNIDILYEISQYKQNNKFFLSIEPLLGGQFNPGSFVGFDLIIVGAMTGKDSVIPKYEWINSIKETKHHNIHYKNNIKKYL